MSWCYYFLGWCYFNVYYNDYIDFFSQVSCNHTLDSLLLMPIQVISSDYLINSHYDTCMIVFIYSFLRHVILEILLVVGRFCGQFLIINGWCNLYIFREFPDMNWYWKNWWKEHVRWDIPYILSVRYTLYIVGEIYLIYCWLRVTSKYISIHQLSVIKIMKWCAV